MLHTALLTVHVAAGGAGLLAGPIAMRARKGGRWHVPAGWSYQACCGALCATALGLVALDPTLWGFGLIAVATEAAAVGAVLVRRRRRPGWLPLHANLALSSYVSFVTAFVVQTAGGFWWVLPVAVGTVAVSGTVTRLTVADRHSRSAQTVPAAAIGAQPG